MAREVERLNDRQLKALKKRGAPGLHHDGGGLYFRIGPKPASEDATPAASWLFRYMLDGKAREMGLGAYPTTTLAAARGAAEEARQLKAKGSDPIDNRAAVRALKIAEAAKAVTFRHCAEAFIEARRDGWKNAKHAAQWTATLETYAMPKLGGVPVASIDVTLVHSVLEPIWRTKTETASRVRGRIESVLDWATTRGYRQGENPARWRGHLEHLFPARASIQAVQHHAALPYAEMPAFWVTLAAEEGLAAEALRFTILTAGRTSEVVPMTWSEVNFDAAVWTVPPARMKGKKNESREHRVPLSKPALALLRARYALTGGQGYIFPGNPKRPLSNMAMLALLGRMGRDDITVHGFRSTFRDWVEETTNYAGTVAEAALAHVVGDKVEAAYRRGDLFEKRRRLMNAWATFCTTPMERGKIINIRRSAANA